MEPNNNDLNPEKINSLNKETSRLFLTNIVLSSKLKDLIEENNKLKDQVLKLSKNLKEWGYEDANENEENKDDNSSFNSDIDIENKEEDKNDNIHQKRIRKKKDDVIRNFKCSERNCNKSYGSEVSLNQHIKLKHIEKWKSIKNNLKENNLFFQSENENQFEKNDIDGNIEDNKSVDNQQNNNNPII